MGASTNLSVVQTRQHIINLNLSDFYISYVVQVHERFFPSVNGNAQNLNTLDYLSFVDPVLREKYMCSVE